MAYENIELTRAVLGKVLVNWFFSLDQDKKIGNITVGEIEKLRESIMIYLEP